MASEPCKLIGKMVVKVNLVGSQAVVWLRWRARGAHGWFENGIRGGQEPKRWETPRNSSVYVCVFACFLNVRASDPTRAWNSTRFIIREQTRVELTPDNSPSMQESSLQNKRRILFNRSYLAVWFGSRCLLHVVSCRIIRINGLKLIITFQEKNQEFYVIKRASRFEIVQRGR